MAPVREIARAALSGETLEGAGVRLHRAFGYSQIPLFDPFLMLDDFRADRPEDYLPGFPRHPHRGIETVTYMLDGRVEHGDSMGHAGNVKAGDVQWMTAGSGIIHQEMPKPVEGKMGGFQLWVNLPRSHKMMDPRYQEVSASDIPTTAVEEGGTARIVCGRIGETTGPVTDIVTDPDFFDVTLEPNGRFFREVRPGYTAAVYVIGGTGIFDPHRAEEQKNRTMILYGTTGHSIDISAGGNGTRFLYLSGKPLREPIAWGGPIVMNTEEELQRAFAEYQHGTFLRRKR